MTTLSLNLLVRFVSKILYGLLWYDILHHCLSVPPLKPSEVSLNLKITERYYHRSMIRILASCNFSIFWFLSMRFFVRSSNRTSFKNLFRTLNLFKIGTLIIQSAISSRRLLIRWPITLLLSTVLVYSPNIILRNGDKSVIS